VGCLWLIGGRESCFRGGWESEGSICLGDMVAMIADKSAIAVDKSAIASSRWSAAWEMVQGCLRRGTEHRSIWWLGKIKGGLGVCCRVVW